MFRLFAAVLVTALALTQVHASTGVFNVRSFGAKGDGVTDDSAAISSATQALIAGNAGGNLYFPAGKYYVGPSARTSPLIQVTNSASSANARFSITGDAYQSTSIVALNQQSSSFITAAPGAGVATILIDINGINFSFLMAGSSDKITDTNLASVISLQSVSQSTIDSIKISATAPISTPFAALYIGGNCSNVLVEDSQLNVEIESPFGPSIAQAAAVRVAANTDQIQLNRLSIWSDDFSSVNGIEIDRNSGLTEINLPIFTNLIHGAGLITVDESQRNKNHSTPTSASPATVLMGGAVAKNVSTCVNLFYPLLVNITKSSLNCSEYGLILSSADGLIVRLDTSKVYASTAILQASGELSLFSNEITHSTKGLNVDLEQPWSQSASLYALGNTFQAISASGVDVNFSGINLTDLYLVNNQCLDTNGRIQGSGDCTATGCTISGNQGCTVTDVADSSIAEY